VDHTSTRLEFRTSIGVPPPIDDKYAAEPVEAPDVFTGRDNTVGILISRMGGGQKEYEKQQRNYCLHYKSPSDNKDIIHSLRP
jgi:hypothetical protein